MFDNLADRLKKSIHNLRGLGRITEDNIKDTVESIRKALIEADVSLSVITPFLETVKEKSLGQAVSSSIRPGEALIKIVQDELTHILGEKQADINLQAPSPIVFLMAGLQGSGKTTTAAKLAKWLKAHKKKSVMLVSVDIYRPAAIEQLASLAKQIDVNFFESTEKNSAINITKAAIEKAKKQAIDVLIIDTAGRLHIDDALMQELGEISTISQPTETLLVVDSMLGQDAANVAKTFNEKLTLTGIILTKIDGDARGGAALSMRMITEKPIKFLGVGEKIDDLEAFHPDRIAKRILGMGDMVSLVEEVQRKVDKKQADKMAQKISKGKRFNFNDFLEQLHQMKKMGGLASLISKLPGMGAMQIPKAAMNMIDDKLLIKMEAMIYSMTPKERAFPALMNGSRKRRIADGSGTNMQDINKFLKQFDQMQKMLKRFKGDKMMKQLKALQGQLPTGFESL